jgi:hypothetical protein
MRKFLEKTRKNLKNLLQLWHVIYEKEEKYGGKKSKI